jgi:D-alanyl-D-alanine carboxypeptidase/D-alanyl-D-alanine-endopeptidase (penicillin-binding protein 4)
MNRRNWIKAAVAAGAVVTMTATGTLVAHAQATDDAGLADALDAILADPRLTDSQIGVVVADAATGTVLYDRGGDKRGIPASNIKLATAAAALENLGADYRFTTSVIADAAPRKGAVKGDLYLRGGGDPTILQADYEALAADLAAAGVTTVKGDLVADDTAFDNVRLGTEYGWDDLQYLYANETSALTVASGTDYNAGTVRVFIQPGAAQGDPAKYYTVPETDYVSIVNEITTTASGSGNNLAINRDDHANVIRLTGTIAAGSNATFGTRSVIQPAGLAADVFANALDKHGITVNGEIRIGKAAPKDGHQLAAHQSRPLSALMGSFLKPSNSSHANALFKTLGYERSGKGTWASGKAAVYAGLEKYGVNTEPIRQVDGSGVSRHNLFSASMIADLLIGAQDAPWFNTWHAALPVACSDGTLASRMCGTPAAGNLRAKTGSMTSVTALSGYVTDADGRRLVFSVIINDSLSTTIRVIEDRIGAVLAGHSATASEEQLVESARLTAIEDPEADAGLDEAVEDEWAHLECSWVEPSTC